MAGKIRQCFVSGALSHFKDHFVRNNNLIEYSDNRKPAIFFGCYGQKNYDIINMHNGLGIIVWGGSDAMHPRFVKALGSKKNLRHVALSDYVARDFKRNGIPKTRYRRLPLIATNHKAFMPTPCGNSVYAYLTMNKRVRQDKLYNEVKSILKKDFNIIEINPYSKRPQSEFIKIIDQCFVGLRLVNHDGLSNTVVELGLKGRKCLWNGGSPNSIPYKNASNIIDAVKKESLKIGKIDQKLSDEVREFINVDEKWLMEEYWNA